MVEKSAADLHNLASSIMFVSDEMIIEPSRVWCMPLFLRGLFDANEVRR